MACAEPISRFDDESFALQLQLQEIEAQRELQSGKWPEDSPPDYVVAFDDFELELQRAMVLIEDLKLAHSIARAVDSDAVAIEELRVEETQFARDRDFAQSLNEGEALPSRDPDQSSIQEQFQLAESVDWDNVLRATEASTLSVESDSTVAGPSVDRYALRQKAVLEHSSRAKLEWIVCGDFVYLVNAVRLACNDVFCKKCLKSFFLQTTKDETLFPPKCHRQPIDIGIIEDESSAEELSAYLEAEL